MKHQPLSFLVLLALSASALSVHAEEWSRFRGPNGTGVAEAKGLPTIFDAATTTWKVDLGAGWSSPVFFKDKLFVMDESSEGKRAVLCLNAGTGKTLWSYEAPFQAHKKHKFNSYASTTPFVDEARVYIVWANGDQIDALALDHTGKVVWKRDNLALFDHEHGYGASPIVVNGILIVRNEQAGEDGKSESSAKENSILGLDAATGATKWKHVLPASKTAFSTPVVRDTAKGKEVIIADSTSGFVGLDAATGNVNWQHNPGYKMRSVGSIALQDNFIFGTMGQGGNGQESAALKLGNAGEAPAVVFEIKKGLPYVPTPLIIGGEMYLLNDGGIFTCFDLKTGSEVYSERLSGATGNSAKFFSSPIAGDGKIFCCSQTGDVIVVKAGPKFELLGASKLDAPINSTPAIAWNHLFVRTEKTLWCLGSKPQLP